MPVWLLLFALPAVAVAADADAPALLKTYCVGCHSPANRQAGLDLTTREKLIQGGDRGAAIGPGDPDASALMQRLRYTVKPGMPLNSKPLPAESIAKIADWIKQGAPYPEPLAPQITKRAGDSTHWAFQKPVKAPVPKTKSDSWVRNPIDSFLAADWEARQLTHAPEADGRVLLRRVYLDLTGLPPTVEEVQAFLHDQSPDWYDRRVDQL